MAALTTQVMTTAGLAATYGAAAGGGDTADGTSVQAGGCFLHVKNGGGSPINVTLADPYATLVGNPGTAAVVAVANGAEKFLPLLPGHINPSTNQVAIAYSAVTSVTVAVVRR